MLNLDIDKYANFKLQKIAVAVAISVIKCKPESLSTIDFCSSIQTHISDTYFPIISGVEKNTQSAFPTQNLFQFPSEGNCSQTFCSQNNIFNDIQNSFDINEEESEKISENLEILQAVSNVKRIICTLFGETAFDGVNTIFMGNKANLSNSQDSGYNSSQLLSGTYVPYKRKDTGLSQLNFSLKKLIDFIADAPVKFHDNSIVIYTSDVCERTIEILYQNNIFLPFYDHMMETIDRILEHVLSEQINCKQNCVFTFFLLNKASIMWHHSMMKLIIELQKLLDKLSKCGALEVLEINETDEIDSSFFTFHLLEGLLRHRYGNKSKRIMNHKDKIALSENKAHLQSSYDSHAESGSVAAKKLPFEKNVQGKDEKGLRDRFTALLNRAVLECVDTYPLLAFWAMNCLNFAKQ